MAEKDKDKQDKKPKGEGGKGGGPKGGQYKKKPHNRKPVWGEKLGWLRPTKGALSKPFKRSDQIHS